MGRTRGVDSSFALCSLQRKQNRILSSNTIRRMSLKHNSSEKVRSEGNGGRWAPFSPFGFWSFRKGKVKENKGWRGYEED